MKTRAIVTTVVSFLLLVAVVAAGLNAIFTITLVDSTFEIYSDAGREDAESLKAELDKYVGSSTTFLHLEDVENVVGKYPCLRLESVGKRFPKTLEVKVAERKEFYAVPNGETYAVLDEGGIYLYDGENKNRLGGMNVVLEGFDVSLSRGERTQGPYLDELYEMFSVFSELFDHGGVRANVVSVSLVNSGGRDKPENYFFVVTMREGVKIVLQKPSEGIAVKARAALTDAEAGYLSPNFADKNRVYGTINVSLLESGEVTVTFSPLLNL